MGRRIENLIVTFESVNGCCLFKNFAKASACLGVNPNKLNDALDKGTPFGARVHETYRTCFIDEAFDTDELWMLDNRRYNFNGIIYIIAGFYEDMNKRKFVFLQSAPSAKGELCVPFSVEAIV